MHDLRVLWPWPGLHVAGAHTLPHPLIIPPYRIPNRMGLTCNLAGTDILSDLSLHFGLTPWFFLEITLFPFRKEPAAKYFLDYWIFPLCLGGWSVVSLRCSSCCRPVPSREGTYIQPVSSLEQNPSSESRPVRDAAGATSRMSHHVSIPCARLNLLIIS